MAARGDDDDDPEAEEDEMAQEGDGDEVGAQPGADGQDGDEDGDSQYGSAEEGEPEGTGLTSLAPDNGKPGPSRRVRPRSGSQTSSMDVDGSGLSTRPPSRASSSIPSSSHSSLHPRRMVSDPRLASPHLDMTPSDVSRPHSAADSRAEGVPKHRPPDSRGSEVDPEVETEHHPKLLKNLVGGLFRRHHPPGLGKRGSLGDVVSDAGRGVRSREEGSVE